MRATLRFSGTLNVFILSRLCSFRAGTRFDLDMEGRTWRGKPNTIRDMGSLAGIRVSEILSFDCHSQSCEASARNMMMGKLLLPGLHSPNGVES